MSLGCFREEKLEGCSMKWTPVSRKHAFSHFPYRRLALSGYSCPCTTKHMLLLSSSSSYSRVQFGNGYGPCNGSLHQSDGLVMWTCICFARRFCLMLDIICFFHLVCLSSPQQFISRLRGPWKPNASSVHYKDCLGSITVIPILSPTSEKSRERINKTCEAVATRKPLSSSFSMVPQNPVCVFGGRRSDPSLRYDG